MTTNDKAVELLPCPFCGKAPLIVCDDNSYGSAMITCGDPNECLVDVTAWGDLNGGETLADAQRAWNTRASLTQPKADEGGWQPIETAPRDGTLVLVIDSFGEYDFGSWHRDHICGEGSGAMKFTHWMPLPDPPEQEPT